MKFEEYKKINKLKEHSRTEQSEIFLNSKNHICKHYFNRYDKENESTFYHIFGNGNSVQIPTLFMEGDDFIETELFEKQESLDLAKAINEISFFYKKTNGLNLPFSKLDLSKDKLLYRINYLKDEANKRGVNLDLLDRAMHFVLHNYSYCPQECVVHGDLKSPHIFSYPDKTKFIDFALAGISNPWYDLSFLCMEEQNNKKAIFDLVVDSSFSNLKSDFDLDRQKTNNYLLSSMFYRTLYLFGFALRHRTQKSLDRVIKELNEIMEFKQ